MPPRRSIAIWFATGLISCCPVAILSAKNIRVLMIGNSYTAQTNASLQAFFANDPDNSLTLTLITPGGFQLNQHAANAGTTNTITFQGPWDYVILQEQSQIGAYAGGGGSWWTTFYTNGVLPLSNLARDADAGVILFMTWARAAGDTSTLPVFGDSPITMQNYLQAAYNTAGALTGSEVAPVGEAWEDALLANPTMALHSSDKSHPSAIGSFLTGAVLYEAITGLDARDVAYNGPVSAVTSAELKSIAHYSFYHEWIGQFSGVSNTDPCADPDRDGVKNEHEWVADTHPGDAGSKLHPKVSKQQGSDPVVSFDSSPYRFYLLQGSDNLHPGSWTTLRSNWPGDGSAMSHTDMGAGSGCRHYRLLPSIK